MFEKFFQNGETRIFSLMGLEYFDTNFLKRTKKVKN